MEYTARGRVTTPRRRNVDTAMLAHHGNPATVQNKYWLQYKMYNSVTIQINSAQSEWYNVHLID
jgi:hypothetical protein